MNATSGVCQLGQLIKCSSCVRYGYKLMESRYLCYKECVIPFGNDVPVANCLPLLVNYMHSCTSVYLANF